MEIRCELKKTGDFANTLYTIRYFQFEGDGTLKWTTASRSCPMTATCSKTRSFGCTTRRKVTKGQTVEIRCELKKEGDFANTLYTIRYFQFEGERCV